MPTLIQIPAPGSFVMRHRGDVAEFTLELDAPLHGAAWLRTNLGQSQVRRREIVRHVEEDAPFLARDWHDIAMRRVDPTHYAITVPLLAVGAFEAKTLFIPEGTAEPLWPAGDNTRVKVEPADTCCCNTIYNAFVRQFGENRTARSVAVEQERAAQLLEQAGYHVIPKSGTFRELIRELDFIIGKLHFRILLLLPIHPTPSTFARMGRFGSPYASINFRTVDATYAEFDRKTTPTDQFLELVDAVHARSAKVFLDIPINHTGWASSLQVEHPEWFARGHDREFESPGAWGVTWADLSKLDYSHRDLWTYIADVFLHWCRHGVDGFRCDAGYMIPFPVWEYIVAKVRLEYPDTIFLLEGLGGSVEATESLLTRADLNWAYSELFQNYDRAQVEGYLSYAIPTASSKGTLVNFAETHDNIRLAATSRRHAVLRTALTALCSQSGAFGITNGVEWLADERVNVHGAAPLNWGNPDNLVDHLVRLNAILEAHPSFHSGAEVRVIPHGGGNGIALVRRHPAGGSALLVLANLDEEHTNTISWSRQHVPDSDTDLVDLVSGRTLRPHREGDTFSCPLAPGEALCLTADPADLPAVLAAAARPLAPPGPAEQQRLRAKAFEVWRHFNGHRDVSALDTAAEAARLRHDPRAYCALLDRTAEDATASPKGAPRLPPVTGWQWPRDTRRIVMLPPGHFLCVAADRRFVAEIRSGDTVLRRETSLGREDGSQFALLMPLDEPAAPQDLTLHLQVFEATAVRTAEAPLLLLPAGRNAWVPMTCLREAALLADRYALCTNGRGAMAQVRAAWGEIRSKYDALLAGNLHPDVPVDLHTMFTRCRGWLLYRGYSHEINRENLTAFSVDAHGAVSWEFEIPSERGELVNLIITLRMTRHRNAVALDFLRRKAGGDVPMLDDRHPVKLILRPDIEDRNHHEVTKAFAGAEAAWQHAVATQAHGFTFGPSPARRLRVTTAQGRFFQEPQWSYMVGTPVDAERGLDSCTDLFSPGYFSIELKGGESARLQAEIMTGGSGEPAEAHAAPHKPGHAPGPLSLLDALRAAIAHYVVKRDDLQTVIAGYPWFLDWGRDTLICLRGMIASGLQREAREILTQFARFESEGTIPNMIRGNDHSNRDTSDAPLWFMTACADLVRAGDRTFLGSDCGGRTVREVLVSIATHYMKGTSNGIGMDPDSGLIYSPPHFTWMDTNYPAATPREGYPVEIQALWYAGLHFLGTVEPDGEWKALADRVRGSFLRHFRRHGLGYLSDCLHAPRFTPAAKAVPDDALRPNQLLAITLGAVTDLGLAASMLEACEALLIPGAIRSLADRPVTHPLPVNHRGWLLNDPMNPYWGQYTGDEDTRRKPAYHNGTAWTWQFPLYPEALVMVYGDPARPTALSLLGSSTWLMERGCLGQIPEIADGNAPHILRGCGAQAWGVTELYRVLALLNGKR